MSASPHAGLALRGLAAQAGAFRLGPLDLDVPPGYAALLGPSGAGKSTLLRVLAGSLPASAGTAHACGAALLALPPEARQIGLVPQGGLLFPHLRVDENVAFGVARAERGSRVAEALDAVGAAHLARRDPRTLSGGETMRVALARALAIRPRLLLLDEPLAALDPASRAELLPLLAALPAKLGGIPILHVTHDFEEAFRLADHLAILLDGTVAAAGTPDRLFARPPSAAVAAFLHVDNLLAGTLEPAAHGLSVFRRGALTLHVAGSWRGPAWLVFDGSALLLAAWPPPEASARNVIRATVRSIHPLPRGLLVHLDAAGVELRARITADARDALHLAPGVDTCVLLKATSLQVIPRV